MTNAVISIQNGANIQQVLALDGVVWETARRKTPGKLTFTVVKDDDLDFEEGNAVTLTIDDKKVFFGFVFTKSRNNNDEIKVTCYDQLRYFKNKDTYVYSGKSATEVIRMIANDFRLQTGTFADTRFKMAKVEDNKELFEIVQGALDETTFLTGEIFVLYDDFGKLTLKNVRDLRSLTLIDSETAESFDYTSSIDSDTYNKIKLVYEDKDAGKREIYISQDSGNQNRWGILQHFEKIEKGVNGKVKADTLLKLYNKKTRSLSIDKAFGDLNIRGGSTLPVALNIGDIIVSNYMLVESVKHTFKNNEHTMDLELVGGEFGGS